MLSNLMTAPQAGLRVHTPPSHASDVRMPAVALRSPKSLGEKSHPVASMDVLVTSDMATREAPEWACCHLTGRLLKEPVLAPDGHSYERSSLTEYLATHDSCLPDSALQVQPADLWADYKHGEAIREGRDDSFQAVRDGDYPDLILCDIGMDLMDDPVLASDGRLYDLKTLMRIYSERQGCSPYGNQELKPYAYRHRTAQNETLRVSHSSALKTNCMKPARVSLPDLAAINLRNDNDGQASRPPMTAIETIREGSFFVACGSVILASCLLTVSVAGLLPSTMMGLFLLGFMTFAGFYFLFDGVIVFLNGVQQTRSGVS